MNFQQPFIESVYADGRRQERARMQQRCHEEGHTWEHLPPVGDVCKWCDAVAAVDHRVGDEEAA